MKVHKFSCNIHHYFHLTKPKIIKNYHLRQNKNSQKYSRSVKCQSSKKQKDEDMDICLRALKRDQNDKILRIANKIFPEGTDWGEFWNTDDFEDWFEDWKNEYILEGGYDPNNPSYEPNEEDQKAWTARAAKLLENRPDFIKRLPYNWSKQNDPEPPRPTKEFDPETDAVDLRAMVEKRRDREKSRRAWRKRCEIEPGLFPDMSGFLLKHDLRISDAKREAFEWTDLEAWNIVIQNGRGADPREAAKAYQIMDPDEVEDSFASGGEYIEETDEFIRGINRMVDHPDELNDIDTIYHPSFRDLNE